MKDILQSIYWNKRISSHLGVRRKQMFKFQTIKYEKGGIADINC